MMATTWATGEQLFFKEEHFPRTTPPTGMKLAVAQTTGAPPTGAPPTGAPPTGAPPTGAPPTGAPPTGAPPTGAPPTGAPPTHSNASPTDAQMTPPIAHQLAATRSAEDLEKHCQMLEEKLQRYKDIAKGRENEIKVLKDDLAELKEKDKLREEKMKQLEYEVKARDRELVSLNMKIPPSPQSPGGEQLYSMSLRLEEVSRLLAEREKEIANLKVQLETFEKVADEGQMFREHFTLQSEVVFRLKREKEALEVCRQTVMLYLFNIDSMLFFSLCI